MFFLLQKNSNFANLFARVRWNILKGQMISAILNSRLSKVQQSFCRYMYILVAGCLLLMPDMVMGSYGQHFIRVSGAFSYARDFSRGNTGPYYDVPATPDAARGWVGQGRSESVTRSIGMSPQLGVGYRYKYKSLIVDAGISAEYRSTTNGLHPIIDLQAAEQDTTTGLSLTAHYTWNERVGKSKYIGIGLPVMIGGEWNRFYIMGGAKINLDVWSNVYETGLYSYRAKFDRYPDMVIDIPGHGIVENKPYRSEAHLSGVLWDVRACGELGFRLNKDQEYDILPSREPARFYLALFAEYAFMARAEHYSPLLVGLRFTALLPIPEPKPCMCEQ